MYCYGTDGQVEEILHTGADFKEHYRYDYDIRGNKVSAEKERAGIAEDSGRYEYSYEIDAVSGIVLDFEKERDD